MLHATLDLARRIDRAEIDFCAIAAGAGRPGRRRVARGRRRPRAAARSRARRSTKCWASGWVSPVEDADLDAIEAFYDERGIPVQIELCPLAVPGLSARLTKRGYQLQGFENQLARVLGAGSDSRRRACA